MPVRERGRTAALWLAPIALMAAIFAMSAMSSDETDRGLVYLLLRKSAHFAEYALLTVLWWRALRTRTAESTALVAAFAIAVGYAITDEIHQTFVEGRIGSALDVLIDSAGAATAVALAARRRGKARA
jgi:VanZ family protein